MQFRHALTYDAAPDAVFAMLADPAFREKVCAAQDVVSADVRLTPSGDGFELEMDQVQHTAGLPAIARKITGDTTEVTLTESWSSSTHGTLDVVTPGKPTTASGTITLAATGTGTTETVELEITVKVPLVGGRLEGLMAENIKSHMDVEHTVGAAWLAGEK
ncbi:DUF2505 domain-containing protein [Nocardioides sp. C4-1]|uniref:DUF2505 domain-containing protein n=1 Tax=Nocardioides sp. C4-1 TaxID=3151851 RepID=UPI003263BCD3